jgi:hypothetical protein
VGDEGAPAWIASHVRRLILSWIVLYGLTLFLATAGLYEPLSAISDSLGLTPALAAVIALLLAAVLTFVVVLFDLRAKVHY